MMLKFNENHVRTPILTQIKSVEKDSRDIWEGL